MEKPYKCQYCNNKFSKRSNLLKHQKTARYCIDLQIKYGEVFRCEYCNTKFATNSNLQKHLQTANYCKELRPSVGGVLSFEHECEYCGCGFTKKHNLNRHYKVCDKTREPIGTRDLLVEQNKQMFDMVASIMKALIDKPGQQQVGGNRNVNVNNLQPITEERLQEQLEHLTLDFITDGAKGYASFANCYPFKDLVVCTDRSRKKLKYKNSEGEIVEDGGGIKLSQLFFSAIAPKNEELINREYSALQMEVKKIADEGTTHNSNIIELLSKATRLQDLLTQCKEAARGEENELTKEFITHLSKML